MSVTFGDKGQLAVRLKFQEDQTTYLIVDFTMPRVIGSLHDSGLVRDVLADLTKAGFYSAIPDQAATRARPGQ